MKVFNSDNKKAGSSLMNTTFSIREATLADVKAISRLCISGFSSVHRSGFEAGDLTAICDELFAFEPVRADMLLDDRFYLVLDTPEGVKGCLRMAPPNLQDAKFDRNGFELSRFYLDEDSRNGGRGSEMLSFAHKRTRRMGFERCWLHVFIPNLRAQQFYLRHGYLMAGQETLHYRQSNPTGYVMMKDLRKEVCIADPSSVSFPRDY